MKTNKTLYGIMAFGPIVLGLLGIVPIVLSIVEDPDSRLPPPMALLGIGLFILAGVLGLVSMILFIVHMSRNRYLDDGGRLGWILGMVIGYFFGISTIIAIVYFFIQIVRERPPLPQDIPSRPGSNEWDAKLNS